MIKLNLKHDEFDEQLHSGLAPLLEHLHLHLGRAPSTPSSTSLLLVVGKGVHLAWSGEDALVVGVDVVHGEEDGLAAAPKDLAEELARVKRVGEGDREQ